MSTLLALPPYVLVFLGGGVGACLRHALALLMGRAFPGNWPWGTLGINVLGGFFMGLFVGWLAAKGGEGGSQSLRLLLATGLLGGFTTYSAFSLEVFNLFGRQAYLAAALYVILSVGLSVAALWLGLALSRQW